MFQILALALLAITIVPLFASIFLWRTEYAGNSNRALGLSQIQDALDGAAELLAGQGSASWQSVDPTSLALLRRYLSGPIIRVRLGPGTASDCAAALNRLLPSVELNFTDEGILDAVGTRQGQKVGEAWILTDPALVGVAGETWDRLSEGDQRALANQRTPARVERDSARAVIRLGRTGYVWAISAAVNGTPCFELFHPQLEGVDVSQMRNNRGERVGAEIASLRGRLARGRIDGAVRYDYYWKNPEDQGERRKVSLLRYIPGWNLVLCAGLYEDEYFQPARAAESMFLFLVVVIGSITLLVSFLFAGKLSAALNTLAGYSRSTAVAAGSVHSLPRTGIRELDSLGASMSYMEERIIERERALKRELGEKTILVEEIHHRVKNNLAVLASIINLQRDDANGVEANRMLDLLHGRVSSMALVYQQLIGENEFSDLPFDDYIMAILAYYQSSRSGASLAVERCASLEPIRVPLGIAVPLGLIVNELVSNAYYHGAPSGRVPVLSICFMREGADLVFTIRDNGSGLPESYREGMGLTLVRALCAQLGGTFSVEAVVGEQSGSGTVGVVRIPSP